MTEISRVALFGKLNKLGYQAVESATVFCKMRGNPYVELVHWMHQLLAQPDSDMHRIIQHYDLDAGKIATELTRALDMLPRGASTISDLSDHLMDAMDQVIDFFKRLVKGRIDGAEIAARTKAKSYEYKARSKAASAFNNAVDGAIDKAKNKATSQRDTAKKDEDQQQDQNGEQRG